MTPPPTSPFVGNSPRPASRWNRGRFFALALAAITLACPGPALGELTWEARSVTASAELGAERVSATYRFTNTGDDPVTLGEITTACGCTAALVLPPPPEAPEASPPEVPEERAGAEASAAVESNEGSAPAHAASTSAPGSGTEDPHAGHETTDVRPEDEGNQTSSTPTYHTIHPGESGVIELALVVGDRRGPQVKTAKVHVYDGDLTDPAAEHDEAGRPEPAAVTTLTLKTRIPRAYSVSPRLLLWPSRDGADAEKAAVIRPGDVAFAIESVTVSNDAFTAEAETLRDGRVHRIVVKPRNDASQPADADPKPTATNRATITVTTDLPHETLRHIQLVARVMK